MTEVEWLACEDPEAMLGHVERLPVGLSDGFTSHDRKLRLFAVGCCRHIEHVLTDPRCRDVLSVFERSIEGQASEKEKEDAVCASFAPHGPHGGALYWLGDGQLHAAAAIFRTVDDMQDGFADVRYVIGEAASAVALAADMADEDTASYKTARAAENSYQAALLREIFGNPFHPVTFDPAWRTSDVILLAQGIYEERAFDRMPILADALQDAGADRDDLLNHLRDPQATHVRGCWALDLVLGKE